MDMRVGVERPRPGRQRGRGVVVHAVPVWDRTRSAVCGSSVRRTRDAWTAQVAGACPDCLSVLRLVRSA